MLSWYTEGVNAYIELAKDQGELSIEFKLLGYKPDPWTEIDSLTIGKFMAYDRGGMVKFSLSPLGFGKFI